MYVLPICPHRTCVVILTVAQVSSLTQDGFLSDHNRLYHRERKYDAHSRQKGEFYASPVN